MDAVRAPPTYTAASDPCVITTPLLSPASATAFSTPAPAGESAPVDQEFKSTGRIPPNPYNETKSVSPSSATARATGSLPTNNGPRTWLVAGSISITEFPHHGTLAGMAP